MKSRPSFKGLLFILLIVSVGCLNSYGQSLECEELGEQIAFDTTKSIWDHPGISPSDYYCLGQYFARLDLGKKRWLIQTYGNPREMSPCIQCQYKEQGYGFVFHGDIIEEKTSNFIEGYNSVSKDFLKQLVGDSVYNNLDKEPSGSFNPRKILDKRFIGSDFIRQLTVTRVNDTTINVKVNADSIFYEFPQFKTKIQYHVVDRYYKKSWSEHHVIIDYATMTSKGFNLIAMPNGKFFFSLYFDFALIENEKLYCGCDKRGWKDFGYMLPLSMPDH